MLNYNLVGCGLLLLILPPLPVRNIVLMKAEGGGLGAYSVEVHSLAPVGVADWPWWYFEWEQGRVIQLETGAGICPWAHGPINTYSH